MMNKPHELIKTHAQWVMQACSTLGSISQSTNYIDRRYLSDEHRKTNKIVAQWMQQSNMQTWQDQAGNIWGRFTSKYANSNTKTLIMGSHLDTVVNGGKYDGMLGVIAPIALISMLNQLELELPFNIDIVGFCDEEGTRFGTTLLGSRALTGKWESQWAELTDTNGISLRQAMQDFGLDFDKIDTCRLDPKTLLAYIETHIEQGPVLERKDLPVGVVSAIAGAKRLQIQLTGMAGHAGTVPMQTRQDALSGASEMILCVEQLAAEFKVVATVGKITNSPNAVNVIPGHTEFSLDIRSDNDHLRDACLQKILKHFDAIAQKRGLTIQSDVNHQAPAVQCSSNLREQLNAACHSTFELLSGAGHDAMAMADICEIGMLFVRCAKGISHHPDENIKISDVEVSLSVLFDFIKNFKIPS